jgi:hypothetical protein
MVSGAFAFACGALRKAAFIDEPPPLKSSLIVTKAGQGGKTRVRWTNAIGNLQAGSGATTVCKRLDALPSLEPSEFLHTSLTGLFV